MEFLIMSKSNTTKMGLEEFRRVKDGLKQLQNDPRTKAMYAVAGRNDGVMICDVDSAAELDELLNLNPISGIKDHDIIPLVAIEERNTLLEKVERHFQEEEAA